MSSILPKNKLENVNFCPSLLGQKFFVRFLGELKKPRSPFEINWPLGRQVWKSFLEYIEVGHLSRHQHHIFWESFLVKMVDLGKLVLFMLMSQFGEDPYLTRNPVPSSYVISGVHVFLSWFYPKIFHIKSGWNLNEIWINLEKVNF